MESTALSCPKCGNVRNPGAVECPACGVIYDRYRPPSSPSHPAIANPASPDPLPADPLPRAWGAAANPYAAPGSEVANPRGPAAAGGVWRSGNLLVAWKTASLPHRCVACNGPASVRLRQKLYWHSPLLYLLVLLNLIIYAIVALVVRKKAEMEIPLCAVHASRRKWGIAGTVVMVVGGFFAFLAGFALIASNETGGVVLILAFPVLLIGAVVVSALTRPFAPKKIDDQYVWLSKVSPAYLSSLPAVP